MDIPFTKEQYRTLLTMAYLAEWITGAGEDDTGKQEIAHLAQHIYAFAGASGCGKLVEHVDGASRPSPEFENAVIPLIEKYEEEGFWARLVELLASRDLLLEHGEKGVERLSREDYAGQMDERAVVYEEEFEEFGVDRLQIVEDDHS